jgi:hypothetical protein
VALPFPGSVMPNRHMLDALAASISSGLRNPVKVSRS